MFYIKEDNLRFLQWISPNKKITKSRIDLTKILLIDEKPENFLKTSLNTSKNQLLKSSCLNISYINEKNSKKSMMLRFRNHSDKSHFWQGILHFMKEASTNKNKSHIDMMASCLPINDDRQSSWNIRSLENILKENHILLKEKDILEFFSKNGIKDQTNLHIDKSTIKEMLKEFYKVEEIIDLFSKYCHNWIDFDKNSIKFMQLKELKKFFIVEQKQVLDDEALKNIIQIYEDPEMNKIKESKDNMISLNGFQNILFSNNNYIYDINKLQIYQVI